MMNFLVLINCKAIEQKQSMPMACVWSSIEPEKLPVSLPAVKQLFLDDIKKHTPENNYIPLKQSKTIRMMTFNVRMWTTLQDTSNFEQACELINTLDPDIVLLQEVVDWQKTHQQFIKLGFNPLAASCITRNPSFGVAIFAKNCQVLGSKAACFVHQRAVERELCFVRLDICINGVACAVYNTHLEVDQLVVGGSVEAVREQQLREIFADISTLSHKNVLIAGDFNSVREADYNYQVSNRKGWDLLNDNSLSIFNKPLQPTVLAVCQEQKYRSVFEKLGWHGPKFTNWSGRVLDFVFASKEWQLPLKGAYVYYTDISDHLPLIVDIAV